MADCTINGVVVATADEALAADELRQRACSELLRQAAIEGGWLARSDPAPLSGVMSAEACSAIEQLLDHELQIPEPAEADCRRWHAANAARYAVGERVLARHVLFAVTPGIDVAALRQRAEACLIDLRCASADDGRFARAAAELSNCPSASEGGSLGWLAEGDCAPEFAGELFRRSAAAPAPEVGVLPRLVHSRFGLHVVEVLAREAGTTPAFEAVRAAVAQTLRQQAYATALRQYLQLLAGRAEIEGVDLDAAATPLVQ